MDFGHQHHVHDDLAGFGSVISHRIHMYAIYGDIYHQYTPFMLAYIPAPWIRHGYGRTLSLQTMRIIWAAMGRTSVGSSDRNSESAPRLLPTASGGARPGYSGILNCSQID